MKHDKFIVTLTRIETLLEEVREDVKEIKALENRIDTIETKLNKLAGMALVAIPVGAFILGAVVKLLGWA